MSDARIIHTENRTVVEFKMPGLPIWLNIYENDGNFHAAEMWLSDHLERIRGRKFTHVIKTVKYY
jgi:hypothetical protein